MFHKYHAVSLLAALTGALALVAGGSAARHSGEFPNPMESPNLKGIQVGYFIPDHTRNGELDRYEIDVSNARTTGTAMMKVRAFLPGVSIKNVILPDPKDSSYLRVTGGLLVTFKKMAGGFGSGVLMDTKVVAKRGSKICDKIIITLANGKSASYLLPCATVR